MNFTGKRILFLAIKNKEITLAGNKSLKIYGKLTCKSGMRMKRSNRVFFTNENEAIDYGYRPCGHCMKEKYLEWKSSKVSGQFSV